MNGYQLRIARELLSLKQDELSADLEKSQAYISKLEKETARDVPGYIESYITDKAREKGIDISHIVSGPSTENKVKQSVRSVPYYDVDVLATDLPTLDNIGAIEPSFFIPIPFFRDCDFAVKVTGQSMYPKLCSGDIIVVKEIKSRDFIVYGEIYLIVSKTDNYRVVKYLHQDPEDEANFLLVSHNEKVKPFTMPKTELHKLFLVKGRVDQLCL